jgi:hypothetical protein
MQELGREERKQERSQLYCPDDLRGKEGKERGKGGRIEGKH